MGTLWSTNPDEDEATINNIGSPINDAPEKEPMQVKEDDFQFLTEVEKQDIAAKRLAYISNKCPKPKNLSKPKEKDAEDRRYDQYLKDLRS